MAVDEQQQPAAAAAGRPRRRKPPTAGRGERLAAKITETIRELCRWGAPPADDGSLGLRDTLRRDADRIGAAAAAVVARNPAIERAADLLFGEGGPLQILIALAPSVRAARRDLAARRAKTADGDDTDAVDETAA